MKLPLRTVTAAAIISLCFITFFTGAAYACDLCALYTALKHGQFESGTTHFGIAQQYTDYSDVREDGRKIKNSENQFLQSSITQFFVARDLSSRVSLQVVLPVIYRSFRRIEDGERVSGHETGVGDLTLLGRYRPLDTEDDNKTFRFEVLGGIKLPTGNSDPIGEELEPGHHGEMNSLSMEHGEEMHGEHGPISAVHGHDIALGSGSVDFPLGVSTFVRYGKLIGNANAQYTIRTPGRLDYRYANDLQWEMGAGAFLAVSNDYSLMGKVNFLGSYKPEDRLNGVSLSSSYARSIYVGPELILTIGDRLSVDGAIDFPVAIENKDIQIAQSSRVRTAISYRF